RPGHHADDAKRAGRAETRAEAERRVVRRWIDDRETHMFDVGAYGISKNDDLHDRHQRDDNERASITEDVVRLLPEKTDQRVQPPWLCCHAPDLGAFVVSAAGRANRTNNSSTDSVPNCLFNSAGVPRAPIFPATMIEMRSQY